MSDWSLLFVVISIVVTSFGLLRCWTKKDRISDPFFVFNLLWLVVSVLLLIGYRYIYAPSQEALICVLVGVISFNLAALSPKISFKKANFAHRSHERKINYIRVEVVAIFVLLATVYFSIDSVIGLLSGSSAIEIREEYYNASGNLLFYYLRRFVLGPLRYAVIAITIVAVARKQQKSGFLVVCSILIVLLQCLTSGGRYTAINTVFMMLCAASLFGFGTQLSRKRKAGVIAASIFAFFVVVYLTNDRATLLMSNMGMIERLYSVFYSYFAGSVTYLGAVVEAFPFVVSSTFGINFIAGFIDPIFAALAFLRVLPYPDILNVIGNYACAELLVGPVTLYNAMPTIFGYFYIDGGLLGVFIESFLFGYICKHVHAGARQGNLLFCVFYLLLFMQICDSSMRWFLFSPEFALAFLYMPLFFLESRKVKK